jgi:puromycin-sensitive aminopeptidase
MSIPRGTHAAADNTQLVRNILPADPKPSHYDVTLTPDMSTFNFNGHAIIIMNAAAPCNVVTFNSVDLTYESGTISGGGLAAPFEFAGAAVILDEVNMRASVHLPGATGVVGDFTLTLRYRGEINDQLRGFYRSRYTDTRTGAVKYLGTTQLEAVDARRALPCWDEPAVKATFDLTLIVPEGQTALSNMPEKSRAAAADGRVAVAFERTPIMSTYLLAWCIGDLDVVERTIPKTRGGSTLVRFFTVPGKAADAHFGLDIACRVLPLYERFFGSDYLLPKCDLIAVPDFAQGAMENWGLITFRETVLIDAQAAAKTREWVALVVAHELAHQWFGNLVTMQWWSELWLNESFATWMEYWAVDQLYPEWHVFEQFVFDENARGFDLDALESSHPVEVHVVNAEEIDGIFDAISYSKGGAVLRMVEQFIGAEPFRAGLEAYLNEFAFGNAQTRDLWRHLGKAAKMDLLAVLESWIFKQGYPYLKVTKRGNELQVEQRRFLVRANAVAAPGDNQTVWQVPLAVRIEGIAKNKQHLLTQRIDTIAVPGAATWVKVNADQTAFVRVLYDTPLLNALKAPIAAKHLPPLDRFGIISDLAAFGPAGLTPAATTLAFALSYVGETDTTVWCAVAAFASAIHALVPLRADAAVKTGWDAYRQRLFGQIGATLGFAPLTTDDHRTTQLRSIVFAQLVSAHDPAATAAALAMWATRDTVPIQADLRVSAYRAALRAHGKAAYDALTAAQPTAEPAEQTRILTALATGVESEAEVTALIAYLLSDAVRSQNAPSMVALLASNKVAQESGLFERLVTDQWPMLASKFSNLLLGRIAKGIENLVDATAVARLEKFFGSGRVVDTVLVGIDRTLRQGLEGGRVKATWKERDYAGISAYLTGFK